MERNKLVERSIISPLAIKQSLLKRGPNSLKISTLASQTYRSQRSRFEKGKASHACSCTCSSNFRLALHSRTCLSTCAGWIGDMTLQLHCSIRPHQTWLRRPSQRESLVQPPVKYATSFTWLRKRTRHTFLHRRREQLQVYYLRSNYDNFGTIFLSAQFLLIIQIQIYTIYIYICRYIKTKNHVTNYGEIPKL